MGPESISNNQNDVGDQRTRRPIPEKAGADELASLEGTLPAAPTEYDSSGEPLTEEDRPALNEGYAAEAYIIQTATGQLSLRRYGPPEQPLPPVEYRENPILYIPGFAGETISGDPFLDFGLTPAGSVFGMDRSYATNGLLDIKSSESLLKEVNAATAFLNDLTGKKVHLVGHSLGGLLAARAMDASSADRVASLHMVSPTMVTRIQHSISCGLFIRFAAPILSHFSRSIPTMTGRTGYNLSSLSHPRFHDVMFKNIQVPLHIVIGEKDGLSEKYILAKMALAPQTDKKFVRLPDAGHDLNVGYSTAVLDFIQHRK